MSSASAAAKSVGSETVAKLASVLFPSIRTNFRQNLLQRRKQLQYYGVRSPRWDAFDRIRVVWLTGMVGWRCRSPHPPRSYCPPLFHCPPLLHSLPSLLLDELLRLLLGFGRLPRLGARQVEIVDGLLETWLFQQRLQIPEVAVGGTELQRPPKRSRDWRP